MSTRPKNEQVELLELDIDIRLRGLWAQLEGVEMDEGQRGILAAFMRAAYGCGYTDALTEYHRGTLYRENGYQVPARTHRKPPADTRI